MARVRATRRGLMVRFYRHLESGRPKDRALQMAQLDLLRGKATKAESGKRDEGTFLGYIRRLFRSAPAHTETATEAADHPFRWAGFQLMGDWK